MTMRRITDRIPTRPSRRFAPLAVCRAHSWLAFVAVLFVAAVPATAQQANLRDPVAAVAPGANADIAALIDELLALGRENPPPLPLPQGTDPRYGDRMPIVSEEYIQAQARRAAQLLERVLALDTAQLTREQQLDVYVLTDRLRSRLAAARFRAYLVPITDAGGFHTRFAQQARSGTLRTVADHDRYIARLQSFGEHMAQQIALLRIGLAEGHTLAGPSMIEDYAATIRPYVDDDVRASVFYEPLTRMPDSLPSADRARILRDGERAVRQSVLPAYRRFLDFMVDEYLPGVRATAGLSAVPGGREYYEHLVRHYTTLDITAEEVHEIGLRDVARLRAEMEAVMRGTGFQGSFAEFLHFLRTDPQFYVEDPADYIKEAAYIAKRMDGQLPRLFRVLPSTPYGIRPFPDTPAALRGTGANYGLGAPGERAGYYNLNLSAIESRPLYVLEALTFHEAVPGHHLQIMLHRENEGLSTLRRNASITAFVEGWALYAERLGLEVGFFTDPYSDFGRLTYEIWRACRLVVDTGIHAFGWTRQQAIDYMAANTALSVHEITTEVDRYIRSSGQALAYKMGELKITELRHRAEQALGDRFDVREFHHAVLRNGSIPLSFLEQEIDAWIAATLAQPRVTDGRATSDPPPLRVLLVTGGGWHDYDAQKRILADGITARVNAEITIDHEGGQDSGARISRHRDAAWAREFDVVLYNICYSDVRDAAWTDAIVRAHVAHQVPAVVLHCTMHSYNYRGDSPIWSMFVGVRSHRHQSQMPFTVEALEPAHPIMIGFPTPWRTPQGELYEIADVYPTATPLAHALGEDSGEHQVTVWTNRFAGVRVFGTTIGHHNETMATDTYLELIADGLLWAADKLDGSGRPVAGYESQK